MYVRPIDEPSERVLEEHRSRAATLEATGRLARALAHDFNNVLLVVRGYAELLTTRLDEGHPSRAHAEKIYAEAERAVGTLRALTEFARELPLHAGELDLDEELSRLLPEVRDAAGPGAQVVHERGGPLPPVRADPDAVARIVLELARNAGESMPGGGRLTLAAAAAGPHVLLTVADTGRGMDAETRALAFEPLFTTKGPGEGPGLGLPLVHALAGRLGGAVALESEPGEGTTVRLLLPAAAPEGR